MFHFKGIESLDIHWIIDYSLFLHCFATVGDWYAVVLLQPNCSGTKESHWRWQQSYATDLLPTSIFATRGRVLAPTGSGSVLLGWKLRCREREREIKYDWNPSSRFRSWDLSRRFTRWHVGATCPSQRSRLAGWLHKVQLMAECFESLYCFWVVSSAQTTSGCGFRQIIQSRKWRTSGVVKSAAH